MSEDPRLATTRGLVDYALTLRMYGERAPGGDETWAKWDRAADAFMRATMPGPWFHVTPDEARALLAENAELRAEAARLQDVIAACDRERDDLISDLVDTQAQVHAVRRLCDEAESRIVGPSTGDVVSPSDAKVPSLAIRAVLDSPPSGPEVSR